MKSMTIGFFALKFLKFGVVGLTGMVLDFSLTWLFKEKIGFHKYLANSIGFIIAASSNYFLNKIWTFEDKNPEILQQYGMFLFISTIGLGLNNLFIYILHERMNYNFYMAKLFAIGVVLIWNFAANYLITFQN